MYLAALIYVLLAADLTFCVENSELQNKRYQQDVPNNKPEVANIPSKENVKETEKKIESSPKEEKPPTNKNTSKINTEDETAKKVNVTATTVLYEPMPKMLGDDSIQTGAALRGFIVFAGLSVLVILYFVFRSYRLRKAPASPRMVQKYGIRANRSDMEMRPLPLEDEDDDDTVFERR